MQLDKVYSKTVAESGWMDAKSTVCLYNSKVRVTEPGCLYRFPCRSVAVSGASKDEQATEGNLGVVVICVPYACASKNVRERCF